MSYLLMHAQILYNSTSTFSANQQIRPCQNTASLGCVVLLLSRICASPHWLPSLNPSSNSDVNAQTTVTASRSAPDRLNQGFQGVVVSHQTIIKKIDHRSFGCQGTKNEAFELVQRRR